MKKHLLIHAQKIYFVQKECDCGIMLKQLINCINFAQVVQRSLHIVKLAAKSDHYMDKSQESLFIIVLNSMTHFRVKRESFTQITPDTT